MSKGLTDRQIEEEIKKLEQSSYVKLARKEERIRNRRRQRLYILRSLEKKGKKLAAEGITMEMLNELDLD